MSSAGEVVARASGGPSNSSRIGVQAAVRNVVDTADTALTEARLGREEVSAVGAGLAGTTDHERRQSVRVELQVQFPTARVLIMTDLDAALAAAPTGPTIVLIAGTGSAAIGRNAKGQIVRVGGYGRFSSDEGSAFDVGRRAIAAAMLERDKSGVESRFGFEILRSLRCSHWEEVEDRSKSVPDEVYPAIFPVIAASADAGDKLAQNVLQEAAEKLCLLTVDCAARLDLADEEVALVKAGGMLGRSTFFDSQLANALRMHLPSAQQNRLRMSPAQAAALAARDAHD